MASFLLPDLPTLTLLVILSSLGKLFCEVGLPNISLAFFPQLHPAGMATDGAPLMEEGRTGARSGVDGAKPSFLKALFIKELKSLALPSHATFKDFVGPSDGRGRRGWRTEVGIINTASCLSFSPIHLTPLRHGCARGGEF